MGRPTGKDKRKPGINACPECDYPLYHSKATGKYYCGRCACAFVLTKLDKAQALTNSMRLMVRFQPMAVVEVAHRLGVHSVTVRKHVAKAPDLYIFDTAVRYGPPPAWLKEQEQ